MMPVVGGMGEGGEFDVHEAAAMLSTGLLEAQRRSGMGGGEGAAAREGAAGVDHATLGPELRRAGGAPSVVAVLSNASLPTAKGRARSSVDEQIRKNSAEVLGSDLSSSPASNGAPKSRSESSDGPLKGSEWQRQAVWRSSESGTGTGKVSSLEERVRQTGRQRMARAFRNVPAHTQSSQFLDGEAEGTDTSTVDAVPSMERWTHTRRRRQSGAALIDEHPPVLSRPEGKPHWLDRQEDVADGGGEAGMPSQTDASSDARGGGRSVSQGQADLQAAAVEGEVRRSVARPDDSSLGWKTRYMRDETVDVANEPSCQGLLPVQLFNHNYSAPITTIEQLRGQRVLVTVPRFGLGNTLRGFVSSYIYARLTGRRLVRFHGSQHAKVYDTLCEAFECSEDAIGWQQYGSPVRAWKELRTMQPYYLMPTLKTPGLMRSLKSEYPLMVTKLAQFIDGYWFRNRAMSRCVYAAFRCYDLWCVHSRAIHALLGSGPTPAVASVIEEILQRHEPASGLMLRQDVAMNVEARFDVAIHLRTRTTRIESLKQAGDCPTAECVTEFETKAKRNDEKYLRKPLWRCIELALRRLADYLPEDIRARAQKDGLAIFLATDNESLRPVFVSRLQEFGTVFYSAGKVVHTSKSTGKTGRLPTLAEFYLMSKAHVLLESEVYVSTFAYFAGLAGNGTLAALNQKLMFCRVRLDHKGDIRR